MDNALAQLIQSAAGTGAPTNPSSRYYGAVINTFTRADGTQVVYLARRIVPQGSIYTSAQNYAVVQDDRIDNLSARFLGDPLLFWMICDANNAFDPEDLTSQKGRSIQIPLASAIPAGARNG
ncbi:MAG TPA: hypothetical protein VLI45_08760 [Acidobacteriaceae bacterium]|nr:hypothetical protein [Acidobacteriaceae bacterium]